MYKSFFGSKNQVHFNNEHEFYQLLGFLAKSDKTTALAWEHNEDQGAWGSEGRIIFYIQARPFSNNLEYTAGNGGIIISRVNCNDFVENLNRDYGFVMGAIQPIDDIRGKIPAPFLKDFEMGLTM